MRTLVFGTSYCATVQRLRLLEQWAESLQRIAPDMDQLIVDSQSPVFDTAAHPLLSRFGPRLPCPSEPTGDLLTRLDLATICRHMQDRRIDALGAVAPAYGWLETGLLFFRVDFVRRSRLVERYDWRHRTALPYPETVLGELLGGDLVLQLWRGAKSDAVLLGYRTIDLHWLTKAKDPRLYDEFMDGGAWPAREYGAPAGLVDHASDSGRDAPRDPADAARSWRKAADQGNPAAQNRLGRMYEEGKGLPQDHAEAAKWYRRAAEQGDAGAQNNLGLLYAKGWGVAQDHAEAARWYRKSAEAGDGGAQNNLGILCAGGQGVPQDHVLAHMWLNLSAAQRHAGADKNRDIVAARMTPSQIEEAQDLAAAWQPTTGQ